MKVRNSKQEKLWLKIFLPFYCLRYSLHILNYYRYRRYIPILDIDLNNQCSQQGIPAFNIHASIFSQLYTLCWAFAYDPFFLTLFYIRLKGGSQYLRIFKPDHSSLYFVTSDIGKNIILHHPFSTIINAKSIGDNFTIKNNVTIGNKDDEENKRPVIGNNVYVAANAVIFGDITIGDNVTIGAGAVVNKDVPDNCIVVGNPMRIIEKKL